jgi:hypothetical protein
MSLPESYANGFAPRDGRPLYPELWRGCVGAWAPCLGPTGLTLRDWSGFGNHGTLTNGPTWGPVGGRQALSFNGANATTHSVTDKLRFENDRQFSIFTSFVTSSASNQALFAKQESTGSFNGYSLAVISSKLRFSLVSNLGNLLIVDSVPSINDGLWHSAVVTYDGTKSVSSVQMFIDGHPVATTGSSSLSTTTLSLAVPSIGSRNDADLRLIGSITDVMIWTEVMTRQSKLLAIRPGIAYELAPRRRSSSAVQFNRRRRLLVGAGS